MDANETLKQLRKSILAKEPALANIYDRFQEVTLFDYVQGWKVAAGQRGSFN